MKATPLKCLKNLDVFDTLNEYAANDLGAVISVKLGVFKQKVYLDSILSLHVNVKFSKGHLSAPKPESKDIEKSINRMKKW